MGITTWLGKRFLPLFENRVTQAVADRIGPYWMTYITSQLDGVIWAEQDRVLLYDGADSDVGTANKCLGVAMARALVPLMYAATVFWAFELYHPTVDAVFAGLTVVCGGLVCWVDDVEIESVNASERTVRFDGGEP